MLLLRFCFIFIFTRFASKEKEFPLSALNRDFRYRYLHLQSLLNARAPFEDQYFVVKERETETERVKETEREGRNGCTFKGRPDTPDAKQA